MPVFAQTGVGPAETHQAFPCSRGYFTGPPEVIRRSSQPTSPAPVLPLQRQLLLAQQDSDDWKGADVDG
jgi:hypothetical protein